MNEKRTKKRRKIKERQSSQTAGTTENSSDNGLIGKYTALTVRDSKL
jgi:hypothetical protein